MKILLFIFTFSFVQTNSLFAKDIEVQSSAIESLDDIHYGKSAPETPIPKLSDKRTLVYVRASCYPGNLRKVANLLKSSSANIFLRLDVELEGGASETLKITVPKDLAISVASQRSIVIKKEETKIGGTKAEFASARGNTAGFQFNDKKITKIKSYKLMQEDPKHGRRNRSPLAGEIGVKIRDAKGTGSIVDVTFSIPGYADVGTRSNSWCGGYYSPLMVFFNKKRPSFKNSSSFPLIKNSYVHWPEKNAPGYFLVLDRNKDGKITKASELFRDSDKHANGFKHLATLDSNKDGLIDSGDKAFNKLQLWKDKNGNGISEKSELFSLKDKNLYYISLKSKNIEQSYGNRAKAVQRSFFTYKNNKGNFAKSEIIDIWFSASGPKAYKSIRALSSTK